MNAPTRFPYVPIVSRVFRPPSGHQHGHNTKKLSAEATKILKEWMYAHKEKPYLTHKEKLMLALKTNLTFKQITHWFMNARRRLLPKILKQDGLDPSHYLRSRNKLKCLTQEKKMYLTDMTIARYETVEESPVNAEDSDPIDEYPVKDVTEAPAFLQLFPTESENLQKVIVERIENSSSE